jgi:hypothetical protein
VGDQEPPGGDPGGRRAFKRRHGVAAALATADAYELYLSADDAPPRRLVPLSGPDVPKVHGGRWQFSFRTAPPTADSCLGPVWSALAAPIAVSVIRSTVSMVARTTMVARGG